MLQLAHMRDPGFFGGLGIRGQLILDRFGHKLTERNSALGGGGLGPAKNEIRNFQGRLDDATFPYLWDLVK